MSFEIDNDEDADAAEIEEEDWVEYIKRSTIEAMEKMENDKIRCWKLTQRKLRRRLAMRIATSPKERWLIKAAEWNPELSSKYRTNRSIGNPGKRWEDDINEFLKQIEVQTENLTESSNHINKNWINTATDRGSSTRGKLHKEFSYENEKKFSQQTSEVRQWSETERQKNSRHHLTQWKNIKVKERRKAAAAPHSAPHALPNVASAVSNRQEHF